MSPFSLLMLFAGSNEPVVKRDWRWGTNTPVCVVIQDIGGPGEELTISRTPGSDETSILVKLARSMNLKQGHYPNASLVIRPSFSAVADVQLVGGAGRLQAFANTERQEFLGILSNAVEFEVADDGMRGSLRIPVRSAGAAVEALRGCEDRKMREWGIDPVAWHTLHSHPLPLQPLRQLFASFDYPTEALHLGLAGNALTRLEVAADGTVSGCESLNASKYMGFESATCSRLKRARFKPALDAAGNAVAAPYVVNVIFSMGR